MKAADRSGADRRPSSSATTSWPPAPPSCGPCAATATQVVVARRRPPRPTSERSHDRAIEPADRASDLGHLDAHPPVRRAAPVEHIGQTVSVCGWVARRREHGEHLAFVDLRDHSGVVQCVVDNDVDVRSEYVVRITGVVRAAPGGHGQRRTCRPARSRSATARSRCCARPTPPPFPIDARADDVDENVRLQYRYLDLRRERMQRNLRVRAAVNSAIRAAMEAQGFVEVETPMLVPSTPEGAREFLVPSRKEPGSFYALPQSPQLFKQLLMVAGVDRYYQIARCLRDEDLRADRQYEFMQLDAEMSFVDQDDVLDGDQRGRARRRRGGDRRAAAGDRADHVARGDGPLRRRQARPALRHGARRADRRVRRRPSSRRSPAAASIKGIRVPGAAGGVRPQPARQAHRPGQGARRQGPRVAEGRPPTARSTRRSPSSCRPTRRRRSASALGAEPTATSCSIVADEWATTCEVLGQLRNDLGRPPVHEGPYRYVWVVDFPMFVGVDETRAPEARPPPVHAAAPRRRRPARDRPDGGALAGLRPRAQRLGARLGLDPDPRARAAAPGLRRARHHRRGGRPQVRLLPQPVRVRRPAARRVRLRHRPPGGDPRRRGEHPRGHRLPEDAVRRRPDDRTRRRRSPRASSTSSASACCRPCPSP